MFAKSITLAIAGTALLGTVAFAQTPNTTSNTATSSTAKSAALSESSLKGDWRASKVVGLSVYNDNNEKVGSINDLLMDKSGNIKAVVLGVGGFLGVGEHLVAVPLDKVKFVDQPVANTATSNSQAPNRPASTTGSATSTSSTTTRDPWYPDHAVFNATKDELKAMPEFKYSS
jgi:sporulation protein YlmC with PRC-barrel domain